MKVRDILKYMGYYIEMKDKVLWEGSQASGSLTVPGISDYEEIELINSVGRGVKCRKDNYGRWTGGAVFGRYSDGGHISCEMSMTTSGETLTFESRYCDYMSHVYHSDHTMRNEEIYPTVKVIGIEPRKSAILEKIGGGGVLNLVVSLYFRGVQNVKTHLSTQGNWAAIQSIDRPNDTEKQQLCRVPQWIENMLGRSLWKIWRCDSTTCNIYIRKTSRNTCLQHLYNYALQFWECAISKYQQSVYNSIRHKNGQSTNIRKIRLCLYRNRLLKIGGWNYV